MKLLSGDNLHLWRGERHVLRGVSFAVDTGNCLLVTGANGAGKTSLLRAVCGLLPLESGTIFWRGQPAQAESDNCRDSRNDRQLSCAVLDTVSEEVRVIDYPDPRFASPP